MAAILPAMIDLRSDTVTKPTSAMREAMLRAEVGDDVFGEDPTVNALERKMAELFGHEAAIFCSSGTQTNQIAINVHTRPGDEVICDEGAHVYRYEGGGMMANSGCSVKHVPTDRGRFKAADVHAAINDRNAAYLAHSKLVVIENTVNRGGGAIWDISEAKHIRQACDRNGLMLHLDGARIFNAMAVDGMTPKDWGAPFHSISVCLSKGLGAPVGSVLTGNKAFIHEARRVRKRFGGGMRQVGILAAAGLFALEHHVLRLQDDHARAKRLSETLASMPWCAQVMPVDTNIVIYDLRAGIDAKAHVEQLQQHGVICFAIGPEQVRMVTHLDISDDDIDRTTAALKLV
jgi:threonine aldolase